MTCAPGYAIISRMPNYIPLCPEDTCRCGRLNNRVHCPRCGVYSVYAFSRKRDEKITDPITKELRSVQVFECRRCRCVFNDIVWREACSAPHSVTLGNRADQEKVKHHADVLQRQMEQPSFMQRALAEVLKKREREQKGEL